VETSAGEPLISTRPFAVTKCSARLVSNESPRLSGSKPSYTEMCYNILPHPCRRLLTGSTHKHSVYNNPLFPILWEDERNVQDCLHMVKWGVQRVASVPTRAPEYYTLVQRNAIDCGVSEYDLETS